MRWTLARDVELVFVIVVIVVIVIAVVFVVVVDIGAKNIVWIIVGLELMDGQRKSEIPAFFRTIQPPTDLWVV